MRPSQGGSYVAPAHGPRPPPSPEDGSAGGRADLPGRWRLEPMPPRERLEEVGIYGLIDGKWKVRGNFVESFWK